MHWNSVVTLSLHHNQLTLTALVVPKGLSLFLCLWVGGQAAAGAQWEFLAPAGSSPDQAPHPGTGTCGGWGGQVAPAVLGDLIHVRGWARSDRCWASCQSPSSWEGYFLAAARSRREGEGGLGHGMEVEKEVGGLGSDTRGGWWD